MYFLDTLPNTLSQEELIEKFKLMRKWDDDARIDIIKHNLRLVLYLIKKYSHTQEELEENFSIGTIGLIKAVDTYNYNSSISFSTYASKCIINNIFYSNRSNKKNEKTISLNSNILNSLGDTFTLEDILPDYEQNVEENYINKEVIYIIKNLVEKLPEKKKVLIELYFGFNCKPLNQNEIAEKLGKSQAYVCRNLKTILLELKSELKTLGINYEISSKVHKKI